MGITHLCRLRYAIVKKVFDRGAMTLEEARRAPFCQRHQLGFALLEVRAKVPDYLHWGTQAPKLPSPRGADATSSLPHHVSGSAPAA